MYLDTLNQNIQLQVSSQKEIAVDLRNFYCIFTRDRILVSKGGWALKKPTVIHTWRGDRHRQVILPYTYYDRTRLQPHTRLGLAQFNNYRVFHCISAWNGKVYFWETKTKGKSNNSVKFCKKTLLLVHQGSRGSLRVFKSLYFAFCRFAVTSC